MEKIFIETGPVAFTSAGIQRPKSGTEGKFSLWFLAALALAEGDVVLEKFTDEKVGDPRIISLMERVDATLVRELKFGAKVFVQMKDGKTYRGELKNPKGSPLNPLNFEEISAKFKSTAKLGIGEENLDRIIEKVKNLEQVTDIEAFMGLTRRSC